MDATNIIDSGHKLAQTWTCHCLQQKNTNTICPLTKVVKYLTLYVAATCELKQNRIATFGLGSFLPYWGFDHENIDLQGLTNVPINIQNRQQI